MNTTISRRDFVKTSLITATALGLSPRLWAEGAASPRISVQLYSVRDDCAKDFDAALAQVAKMGFAGVEFAGYHKYSGKPKELRKALDDLNLIAAGTHIGTGKLRGRRTQADHRVPPDHRLQVPVRGGDRDFTNPEKSKTLAETFNQTAATLKPLGMYCGYHNHTTSLPRWTTPPTGTCSPSAPARTWCCSRIADGRQPPVTTRLT